MTDTNDRTIDELRSDLEYAGHRLRHYGSRLTDAAGSGIGALQERAARVADRAVQLGARLDSPDGVDEIVVSAVDDLHTAVDTLESDLAAETDDAAGATATLDRQLRTWRARAEHLRVQANLAAMDADDEFDAAVRRIGRARAKAVAELAEATDDGREIASDVRADIAQALGEVREIVERTADQIASRR